ECLHPRPELDFPGPGAALLAMDRQIGFRDRVRIEPFVLACAIAAVRRANRAVDDKMCDMQVLRLKFARHALREAPQAELAHRERRRTRIALHAGRCAREEDAAVAGLHHPLRRLLSDEEAAIA